MRIPSLSGRDPRLWSLETNDIDTTSLLRRHICNCSEPKLVSVLAVVGIRMPFHLFGSAWFSRSSIYDKTCRRKALVHQLPPDTKTEKASCRRGFATLRSNPAQSLDETRVLRRLYCKKRVETLQCPCYLVSYVFSCEVSLNCEKKMLTPVLFCMVYPHTTSWL
jgi:hypothetical protein